MHSAPKSDDRFLFINQNRLKIYSFGLFSTLCILVGQVLFIYAYPYFLPYTIVTAITIFYLAMSYLVGFMGKEFDARKHVHLTGKWFDMSARADVDIYLPVCREPLDIIFNTWEYVNEIKMNHPGVKVYVLDDGKDDLIKEHASRMGFNYITRDTNELKKAGNLRNAFKQTNGEFIAIFDADFCPAKDFLFHTIPYFCEDSNISIVQTPQFFDWDSEKYGWIRNGAGSIQELFYRLIQVNRNTFGGAICVGTNAVYRRAHLEPFGGTAAIPYSEDVHTGFQLLKAGHEIMYIPIILALGVCPDTAKQFFTQQYRWALGSLSLMLSRNFWEAKITTMQRICYMTGMFYYVSTGIGAVTYFLPSIFILIFYPQNMHWYNLLFSVPSVLFSYGFMKYWNKLPFGVEVLRTRQLSYYAHLYALKDRLLNTLEEWKPTGAKFNSSKFNSASVLFTFIALGVPTIIFGMIAYRILEGYNPANFVLLAGFTIYNSWLMIPVIDDLN